MTLADCASASTHSRSSEDWSDLKGEEQKPTFHLLLALSSYVGRVRLRDFLGEAYGGFQLVSRVSSHLMEVAGLSLCTPTNHRPRK